VIALSVATARAADQKGTAGQTNTNDRAATAAPVETPYSGDIGSRPTLTGDWGGARNELAASGITLDLNAAEIGQGVVGGGKGKDWEAGGRADLTLSVDTGKLGLWPGGFFTFEAENNFGNAINLNAGALVPVNSNALFPLPGADKLNIVAVNYTQFLSHYVGVTLGKFDLAGGDMNEFAHGKGDAQFMNLAFNFNPALLVAFPYSTLGAGFIVLPTGDPNDMIISVMALDGINSPNTTGFGTALEANTAYAIEGRVRTNFFEHTGHQLAGFGYSTANFTSLDQSSRLIIQNQSLQKEDHTWAAYYNFDQYIYEPVKNKGIGIFGRYGVTNGNVNPIQNFFSLGLGGKGMIPQRPNDNCGIGYYYCDINNPTFTGPLATRTFLRDEQGVEAYYSIGLTPWAHLTPDIQVIHGAQKNQLNGLSTESVNTATILGLRLQVIF
jgi:porin